MMDVSRSPTSSQSMLSTTQVDRKNQQRTVQRDENRQADDARQANKTPPPAETEQKPKPVVNAQGQSTGRMLNVTA